MNREVEDRLLCAAKALEVDPRNERAWTDFASVTWPYVSYFAKEAMRVDEARQLHQDVLIKIHSLRRFPSFEGQAAVKAFIRTASLWVLRDRIRRELGQRGGHPPDDVARLVSPLDDLHAFELIEAMSASLSELDRRIAAALLDPTLDLRGMAQALGVTINNFTVMKHRFRERLKRVIREEWGFE